MEIGLPRVGSAVVLRVGENILLGLRNKEPERGRWVLPGGGIRPFETVKHAAVRELKEETGLDIDVGNQIGVYEVIAPPNEHRLIVYSWATLKESSGDVKPSGDIAIAKFFSPGELGRIDISPTVRQVLKDIGWL